MSLSNYENWLLIHRDTTSPQSYIDFSFFFLIGAALQRRVWMGNPSPNIPGNLYPNHYTILVGPAGTGKGRVIVPTSHIIKSVRIDFDTGKFKIDQGDETEDEKGNDYAFNCGPNSITFEQLLVRIAKRPSRVAVPPGDPNFEKLKVYSHSSIYLILEELSSLLKHDTRKMCDFLLQAWDSTDYLDETKTQGSAWLKKPCLSFMAGSTVAALEELFSSKLVNDGFVSRLWLIYEHTARSVKWKQPPPDESQKEAKRQIYEHLIKLAGVFGRVEFSLEADEYMEAWLQKEVLEGGRANSDVKLDTYYNRKGAHVKKLCMILVYSEDWTPYIVNGIVTIPLHIAKRAVDIFHDVEKRMHFALKFGGRNPLGAVTRSINNYFLISQRPLSASELLEKFGDEVREMELAECLRVLMNTGKIKKSGERFVHTLLTYGQHKGVDSGTNIIDLKPEVLDNRTVGHDLPALPLDVELK